MAINVHENRGGQELGERAVIKNTCESEMRSEGKFAFTIIPSFLCESKKNAAFLSPHRPTFDPVASSGSYPATVFVSPDVNTSICD